VAREVGVADGALYNHFAGKTELLSALAARYLDSAQRRLDEALKKLPTDGGLEHILQISITTCTTGFSDNLPLAMLTADGTPGRATHQLAEHVIGARFVDIVATHLAASSLPEPIQVNIGIARIIVGTARQLALEYTLTPESPDAEEPRRLAALLAGKLP
jgi:AcrR family transcriptional regulator